jgi:hypothetical protein
MHTRARRERIEQFIELPYGGQHLHPMPDSGKGTRQEIGVVTHTAPLRRETGGEKADLHDGRTNLLPHKRKTSCSEKSAIEDIGGLAGRADAR